MNNVDRIELMLETPDGMNLGFLRGLAIGLAMQLDTAEKPRFREQHKYNEELADILSKELGQ